MAIYSLNLKSIGRSTHASGTAGAHLHYIAREGAEPELVAKHMPTDPTAARTWMDGQERADRKNARVIDKVRIALPRELTPEQRMKLVRDFAKGITKDRVPWFAAIHASGKDALNPHCHLVIRDRDIDTGKRVLRLSDSARDRAKAGLEPKAVEYVRTQWEHYANRALEKAGHDVRIDRRTLEAQGIDREPTIHIGPQAVHVDAQVERPRSKKHETGTGRAIDYPQIDQGRTRQERHGEIVDFNLEKAARSPDFVTRERAKALKAQIAKDRALERRLMAEARKRTQKERAAKAQLRADLSEARAERARVAKEMRTMLRQDWASKRQALTERHKAERGALTKDQSKITSRFWRIADLTGRARQRQAADRAALRDRQKAERGELVQTHRDNRQACTALIQGRYAGMADEIRAKHRPGLVAMRAMHRDADRDADRERQERAAEREIAEKRSEASLAQIEQYMRRQERGRDRGPSRG